MGERRETLQLSSASIYSFLVQQFYSYANGNMTSSSHVYAVNTDFPWMVVGWIQLLQLAVSMQCRAVIVFNCNESELQTGKFSQTHLLLCFSFFSPLMPLTNTCKHYNAT